MVVLRLVHIFAGIMWAGYGMFLLFLLVPTVRKLGPDGQVFMKGFLKQSGFVQLMPILSLLTTVAGAILYYKVSDGFNADWMKSDGSMVLSTGVVAGILAFAHGATATGPTTEKIVKLSDEIEAQGGPPSEEQIGQMQALQKKMGLHGKISVGLIIISIVGMAAARYM